ncbi:hypothetical protein AB0C11_33685 [Streptomyces sp. NPDC039016]|uniref:hypothetical protein n=1 Tax=Streptomyces sp. NPDC039016 TaxID=3154330 RepID=UPI003402DBCE
MEAPTPGAAGSYIVVAGVVYGPPASPVLGNGLFCCVDCAEGEVRELTRKIGEREGGSLLALRFRGRPVGFVVTIGRVWAVQVHAPHELPNVH